MLRKAFLCASTILIALVTATTLAAQTAPRVLVYTRNHTPDGKGYVHANIADSVAAIQRMGKEKHFAVDASDDPAVFADSNLARYTALVFSNSNDEAFANEDQRAAFQHYIHAGHGFLGIHSAAGTEGNWDYFQKVLGGHFAFHPPQQNFTVTVADSKFPATKGLPPHFEWNDECYFLDRLNPDIHVVLTVDRTKLQQLGKNATAAEAYANPLPLAWYHNFDNSREFYLALGHNPEYYANPIIYGAIERGLLWAMHQKE